MKTMVKSVKEERLRWIKPILDGEISIKKMVKVCPFSVRTLKYWLSKYRKRGLKGLENRSTRPKSHPNETPVRIKERVIELRKQTNLCSVKLVWKLKDEGIVLSKRTIDKILKKEGLTRKYRTKKIRYKYVKALPQLGELVEIDVKWVPSRINGERSYQFTAIDCASRWRYLKIYHEQSNYSALRFVKELICKAPFKIRAIKTDNGPYFTNRYTGYLKSTDTFNPKLHQFDLLCQKLNIIHYLIDPGKPAQNGKVERSHRSDQESFYDKLDFKDITFPELKYKLRLWNNYYNNLPHCGLNGKTPNEMVALSAKCI